MKKERTHFIVVNGLFMAMIMVLTLIPNFGFIQIPPLSLTIIHIPVIIGGMLFGVKSSVLLSIAFGVSSWFVASTRGAASDILFTNPLVSILPRVVFGLCIPMVFQSIKKRVTSSASYFISGFLSSLIHSIFVLIAIAISIGLQSDFTAGWTLLVTLFLSVNVMVEAAVSGMIVFVVSLRSTKFISQR